MLYYYKNVGAIDRLDISQKNIFVYPDFHDLRNYAFLYIYPNNQVDAVIRTRNLTDHISAIEPLIRVSENLQPLKNDFLKDDITHSVFDSILSKEGVLQIYYSTSNLNDQDAFGYINVPEVLTEYQKQFIRDHRIYFEIYQEILINQFDSSIHELKELNTFDDGTFLNVLDQLSDAPSQTMSGR